MNYLAHSLLSFSDGQITGQFLEDFIKNKERFSFPEEIQKGIKLHREIDTFTDSHPAISEAKKVFSPLVRLYAGAFVDVAFDYFVAHSMSDQELYKHSQKVYAALWKNEEWLPENLKKMLIKMGQDNWLYNYKEDWGIDFSMRNVLNKAKYLEKDLPVFQAFLDDKPFLQNCFDHFFPELKIHIENLRFEI